MAGGGKKPRAIHVRDGNPGHKSKADLAPGVTFHPDTPDEPNWTDVFPAKTGDKDAQAATKRLRGWAGAEWALVVPHLEAARLLALPDRQILVDHCVAVAIYRECLRQISLEGLTVQTERGMTKNPATTILAQQRDRMKHTTQQLGLSPLARDGLTARKDAAKHDESPFD